MRVALDVTPLVGPATGVGVFTGEVLDLLAGREDVRVVGYLASWRGRRGLAGRLPPRVEGQRLPMAARPLREAWKRADRPHLEWWTGPVDVVHGTNFVVPPTRGGAVVTVHDLTPVRFPELCTRDTLDYPRLVRRAAARGAWVHTPTEFVATEVREWLGSAIDPSRVVAVPNGLTSMAGGDAEAGRRLAGADRYILALGTVEPRKDLPTLVGAFDLLAGRSDSADVILVVAGPDGWGVERFSEAVDAARHGHRVHRLGWVGGDDRADLVAGAAVLAYPSIYEGFGLTPLEAMSAGVPVVCSDAGPLPEVTAGAARLAPVGDADALAAALSEVLGSDEVRGMLVERGRVQAARFSWDRCVEGLVGLYRRAATLS